jgi:hypothetical protein
MTTGQSGHSPAGWCGPTESEVFEVCRGDVVASQEKRERMRNPLPDDVAQKVIVDDNDAHVVARSLFKSRRKQRSWLIIRGS